MDAVLQVVKTTPEPDVLGRKDPKDGTPEPSAPVAEEQADKPTEEGKDGESDDDSVPIDAAATRNKINKLLRRRRELQREVEQLRPDANVGFRLRFRSGTISPRGHRSGDERDGEIRRGDYASFYRSVRPTCEEPRSSGLVFARIWVVASSKASVQREAARELAVHRFNQQRAQEEARMNALRLSAQETQFIQTDVQRAVSNFEDRIAANDPDYPAKADAIRRTAQALLHERGGKIGSVQEALEIVQAAHREVSHQYRRFAPQLRATSPLPNGHSQQPNARPAPKNMMEAALAGLENARRQAVG
jgi:hypothetical protein